VKHLAYFNECGPCVSLLHLDPGASIPSGKAECLDIRVVFDGEVEYLGQQCPAISRLYFPPDSSYEEIHSKSGATLLRFQIAAPGGNAPKR